MFAHVRGRECAIMVGFLNRSPALLISRLSTHTTDLHVNATHYRCMRSSFTLSSKHMRDLICSSSVRLSCVPTYLRSLSQWLK